MLKIKPFSNSDDLIKQVFFRKIWVVLEITNGRDYMTHFGCKMKLLFFVSLNFNIHDFHLIKNNDF